MAAVLGWGQLADLSRAARCGSRGLPRGARTVKPGELPRRPGGARRSAGPEPALHRLELATCRVGLARVGAAEARSALEREVLQPLRRVGVGELAQCAWHIMPGVAGAEMSRDEHALTPYDVIGRGRSLHDVVHLRHPWHDAARRLAEHFADDIHMLRRRHRGDVLLQQREQAALEADRENDREDGDHQGQPFGGHEARRYRVPPRGDRGREVAREVGRHGPIAKVLPQRLAKLQQGQGADGNGHLGEDDHQVGLAVGARLRRGRREHHWPQHAGWRQRRGQRHDPGHAGRLHRGRGPHPGLQRCNRGAPVQDHDLREPNRGDRARSRELVLGISEQELRRDIHGHLAVRARMGRQGDQEDGGDVHRRVHQDACRPPQVVADRHVPRAPGPPVPLGGELPREHELRLARGLGDRGRRGHRV
mmetsp:Transcript_105370/g.304804  ORF Transcript_105370/g.304804 Transcript_105370/m.304804 type:complete len:421 (+) Transcript_105370:1241-2503(+)